MYKSPLPLFLAAVFAVLILPAPARSVEPANHSVARVWNDELLEAIRNDFARPTIHARNLFHVSVAMWDAWAAYDPLARGVLHDEKHDAEDRLRARQETLSHAVHRILTVRFSRSPGAATSLASFDARMRTLGFDPEAIGSEGDSPRALGNRIAASVLAFGASDGSNEANDHANRFYTPSNPELFPIRPGNPSIEDPNRWQALALDFFVDQAGIPFPLGVPPFLGPEWGAVTPFALAREDLTIRSDGTNEYWLYHDPGAPPRLGEAGEDEYREGFEQVLAWSALLDPSDGESIDISPGSRGDNSLGTNDGRGRDENPKTGRPYPPNIVPAGDYYRVLAEFWADGPDSETPPGHWFTIANGVSDHPELEMRIGGVGPIVTALEWDVKLYLALSGSLHDAAIAAWGAKGWYDYVRPISAIRYMADRGQRSDPAAPSHDPDGLALVPGSVELVTHETIQPGERHAHLAGRFNVNVGKIAVRAWRGPDFIDDPDTTTAGVGWILAENWWPYQRPSFVTPPFAGYVSGHSTFSRAAAETLTLFSGDAYFPGGVGEFLAPKDTFLVFEDGPSVDVRLQWATYRDASDETSLSRIYGGIHPRADDIPGRLMGAVIGPDAYRRARTYWGPWKTLELERVTASPDGRFFAEGRIRLGVYGDADRFDPAANFQIRISDAQGELASASVTGCERRSGKAFATRCAASSGRATLWFDTSSAGPFSDDLPFRLVAADGRLRGPVGIAGPLRVEIESESTQRAGIASDCRQARGRLTCRPERESK